MVGRFLYIQIPRTREGRELSIKEVTELKTQLDIELNQKYGIRVADTKGRKLKDLKHEMISKGITSKEFRQIRRLLLKEQILEARIQRLEKLHNLFKYWHVIHLPFALIMLIIMVIHVGVSLYFGYS
jgi:hypothetical protein